ncbi:MAG TPA: hypothetical protein VMG37_23515 [Solirubrobacteraceae bacterium]|nr:hypothetical protein [Solirubrobacteraceae bacterium]
MIDAVRIPPGRSELRPVRARGRWIGWGLALQVVGAAIPVVLALHLASSDGVLGSITRYTVRLVWQQMTHSAADVALVLLGVALFIAGSVVLARPFVRRRSTLLIGVPLAAVGGLLVFGVFAVVIAAVIAAEKDPAEFANAVADNLSWPGSGRRRPPK